MKTPLPAAPEMSKTVMFAATAWASGGIAQGTPVSVTVRGVACVRTDALRESYCRQGVMATNGNGDDDVATAFFSRWRRRDDTAGAP